MLGEAPSLCTALLRVSREIDANIALIDGSLYDELQYSYQCRLVNHMTLRPGTPKMQVMSVYELQCAKDTEMDEWMYQISMDNKNDPLVQWKKVWQHLGTEKAARSLIEGEYGAALTELGHFMDEHPLDPVAPWLEQAVTSRLNNGMCSTRHVMVAGELRFVLHYSTSDARRAPVTARGRARSSIASSATPRSPGDHCSRALHGDVKMFRALADHLSTVLAAANDAVVVIDRDEMIHF